MSESPIHPMYAVAENPHHIPLYAATIHQAIARNDLTELDRLICQAEAHLEKYGDLPVLIEQLKTEIARLEP